MTPKDWLIQIITSQPEAPKGGALVTIREFFEGNTDYGSIGCNLGSDHPGLDFFRRRLEEIEAREDVDELWMEIYDWTEGDWPFSENVRIKGRIAESTVKELTEALMPSEVWMRTVEAPHSRAQSLTGSVFNLWWD